MCPSSERLAAFIDRRCTADERRAITAHLARCNACYEVVTDAIGFSLKSRGFILRLIPVAMVRHPLFRLSARQRLATVSALAGAAAVVLAVWAGSKFGSAPDPLQATLAHLDQSLGEFRPIEARLTGASYRPMARATRAAAIDTEAPLSVRESANAVERAVRTASPAARARALAEMYLVTGRPDLAVDALAPLVSSSHDAGFLSDASAAYFTRARDGDRAQALDAAARAVDIDPRQVEAWFNLGLASEALGQYALAKKAWDRVSELDPASGWSREADAKRANAPTRQHWSEQDKVDFKAAVERGDDVAVGGIAGRSLGDARAFFEQSILATVADRWNRSDRSALTAAVAGAEVAGRALSRLSADRWPVDVALQLRTLVNRGDAAAGRAACIPALLNAVSLQSTDRWSEADVALEHARPCRATVPDTLALHGSFIRLRNAVSATQPGDDLPRQLADLSRTAGTREYSRLQGRTLWLEALVLARRAKYVEALDRYAGAEVAARRGKDLEAEITIGALAAEVYEYLGASETAWRERSRVLSRMYAVVSHQRRLAIYRDTIRACVDVGLYAAALQLYETAFSDLQGKTEFNVILRADRAVLLARLNRPNDAHNDLARAFGLLHGTEAAASFDGSRRYVLKSQAIVSLGEDPLAAARVLTDLIETGDQASNAFESAELFFLRASAFAAQSDPDRADRDFQRGFDLLEQRQSSLPDHLRPAAFDRTWEAVASAIRLHALTRGDPWGALTVAERSRAGALTSRVHDSRPFTDIDSFRRELPSDTAVVFLSALDDGVLSWAITNEAKSFNRQPIAYPELNNLTASFRDALQTGSRESFGPFARRLYDITLASHASTISRKSLLVIVPDGPLLVAPFAALLEPGGRFLIEDRAVVVVPNLRLLRALSLRRRASHRIPSAVAFGNPTLAPDLPWRLPPLPAADEEARVVAKTYAGPVFTGAAATKAAFLDALGHYDVVHFSGHAVVNTSRVEFSSLVLAPSAGDAGVLSPNEIDKTPISPGALVVLAACDTAEGSVFRGEGLMGLTRPFIAAGAGAVVANLWPIEDDATGEFSAAFHHEVRAGISPVRALQRVQEEFVSRKIAPKAWAGWVVIGGYN